MALQYRTCDQDHLESDAPSLLSAMRNQRRKSFLKQDSLTSECLQDPWFIRVGKLFVIFLFK
jgi:hypothetical protein